MSGSNSKENDLYRNDEAVDPRVQIELERLNAATDDINKLEVDLDEARANFRQLLYESSVRIDTLGKKLGSCVEKARPYYEARIRAKEALHETQMAAVRFERANSAHAAAKEMVYLAEEGLNAEGRTFDHAWQEMLNHATMRGVAEVKGELAIVKSHEALSVEPDVNTKVNESELERTLSETEHRRTSHTYQQAEMSVQQLQKELKRSIAKSSYNIGRALSHCNLFAATLFLTGLSYFEMKAQFNQVLEEQKSKVKRLEQKVATAKASYAEALRNLEQISDEIHRIRKNKNDTTGLGVRGAGVGADSPLTSATVSTSTNPDTDRWTDSIGSSDSEHQEEYLRLPDKLGSSSSPIVPRNIHKDESENSEYLSLSTISEGKLKANNNSKDVQELSDLSCVSLSSQVQSSQPYQLLNKDDCGKSLETSEEENMIQTLFSKIVPAKLRAGGKASETDDISVRDLGDHNPETWSEVSLASPECQGEVWTEVNLNDSSSLGSELTDNNQDSKGTCTEDSTSTTTKSKPDPTSLTNWISRSSVEQGNNSRRQSLDTLILGGLATGERVKEIFSQGIMKLNISSLTDRRSSEPKFERPNIRVPAAKKVPSPLEKSMVYLHPEDDSTSDSESLASVEMLTDDQISSLMLEQDLQEVCQNVLGTPISEVAPLFASQNHL